MRLRRPTTRFFGQPEFARAVAVVLLLNAADAAVSTVAPAFLQRLGYPVAQIGLLVSGYAMASLLSRVPAGRLADGSHARLWFWLSSGTLGVALALYPVAIEPWAFWSVRVLHGLSFGAATTLNLATLLATTSANRARVMALYTAAMAGGYTLGNLTGGVVADVFGYQVAFWTVAVFPLLAMLLGSPAAALSSGGKASPREDWRLVLRRPEVRAVLVLALVVNLLHQMWGTLLPLYVVGAGAGVSLAGFVRATHSFTNTLARPASEPIVRRVGPLGLACAGLLVYAVGISLLPTTTAPLLLMALAALIGLGRAGAVLANALGTMELSERRLVNRGTASALMTVGGDAGSILAPILAGATASRIGIGPAMQALAWAMAGLGIVAVLAARPPAPRPAAPPVATKQLGEL
jgi:MFS family permease